MCGIVAVVRRRSTSIPPDLAALLGDVDRAAAMARPGFAALDEAAGLLEAVDERLRGTGGVRALLASPSAAKILGERVRALEGDMARLEGELDAGELRLGGSEVEAPNASLVRMKDVLWALGRDRVRTASAVGALAGPGAGPAALEAVTAV